MRKKRPLETKLPGCTFQQTRAHRRITEAAARLREDEWDLSPDVFEWRITEIEETIDRYFPGARRAIRERRELTVDYATLSP